MDEMLREKLNYACRQCYTGGCSAVEEVVDAALAQAAAQQRERWIKNLDRMAEAHSGPVQAALWGVAEMIQRDVDTVRIRTNTA